MKTRMDPYYAEIYNLISINDQMLGIMNSSFSEYNRAIACKIFKHFVKNNIVLVLSNNQVINSNDDIISSRAQIYRALAASKNSSDNLKTRLESLKSLFKGIIPK